VEGNPVSETDPLGLAPPRQGSQGGYQFPCYFGCAPTPQEQQLNIQIQENFENFIDVIHAKAKQIAHACWAAVHGEQEEDKNCEALYQSTLATCASLTGRKRFACFEAARENREQCYQEKGKTAPPLRAKNE